MTVDTTTHPVPMLGRPRCYQAEPGKGYRLLEAGEIIQHTDDVWSDRLSTWVPNNAREGRNLCLHWRPRRRKLPTVRELYAELIFAVARKFPGETRHQTALRYIREAEGVSGGNAVSALAKQVFGL